MDHQKFATRLACGAVLFAAALGWPAFAQQQPIYKAPTAADWSALAKLPSREILLAQLLGLLQAPASQLLRTIQEPGASLVRLLGAIEKSKQE